MALTGTQSQTTTKVNTKQIPIWSYIWKMRTLYWMSVPGILYFLVFKYIPLGGSVIAFQDYNIFKGFWGSEWVGWDNYVKMVQYDEFLRILKNTLLIAGFDLLFAFPAPILIALLLNEVRSMMYKRVLQTVVYMPHFLSWVIISGIALALLSQEHGLINHGLAALGLDRVFFLGEEQYVKGVIVGAGLWRDTGWGTIIYLAAITGINPDLYEAAEMDGANRWRQTTAITLPALLPTITILFLMQIGHFLDFGFERVFVFLNSLNQAGGDTLDTYIYRVGLLQQQYSYTTAIGLFKSLVGLILLVLGNTLSKKATGQGLF
ncbi:ABC transporter permease subunit [Paenibacillus qinlingensis]|uniref:Aldouronate transport system permease protein n=1 Tax=Paenibacillus qinlingensis TaxID=1837343 RepID=A0ABU1NTM1_9BACL|nr:ABC transporter permease subunit [Paenibacillus qinlingensis]MDR6550833.1 putative aldouronate transport system permease protein [Paenibacillus qinlingensis]